MSGRWSSLSLAGVRTLVVGLLAVLGAASAGAQDDRVFTVGNYPVDARANDAVAAKEKAMTERLAEIAKETPELRRKREAFRNKELTGGFGKKIPGDSGNNLGLTQAQIDAIVKDPNN